MKLKYFIPFVFGILLLSVSAKAQQGTFQAIDLEFEKICMIDSISPTQQVQYWRVWNINTSSWVNVDKTLQLSAPYTPVGKSKTCEEGGLVDIVEMCDITQTTASMSGGLIARVGAQLRITIPAFSGPITSVTCDCGQGQIFHVNPLQPDTIWCNYAGLPDGFYPLRFAVSFMDLQGVDVRTPLVGEHVEIRGGALYSNDTPFFTANFGHNFFIPVQTPFLKYIYGDGTSRNVSHNGVPYTPTGTLGQCTDYYQEAELFVPSTRPNTAGAGGGGSECWVDSLAGGVVHYYDVYRDISTNTVIAVINQLGHDTILPASAEKLPCELLVGSQENCLVQNIAEQAHLNAASLTYTGNTYHSITFTVISGTITVTVNGVSTVYMAGFTKGWEAEDCKLIANSIIVDASNGYAITGSLK